MARAAEGGALGGPDNYWRDSEAPLSSLVFLLPLIVLYEAGTRWLTGGSPHRPQQQIIAFLLMKQFFGFFGADAKHLPALAIAGILLTWHIARKDLWKINLKTLGGMAAESVALAVPVLMLGLVMPHYFPLAGRAAAPVGGARLTDFLVLSVGAGVYEELVFRLILLTFLSLILRDAFQIRPALAGVLMVVISGVLFSAYHYLSPYETFQPRTFVFRTLAGIYFGVLFLTRGFGVTAASHSAYDIFIVMLTAANA